MKTGSEIWRLESHTKSVLSISFSPSGELLASGRRYNNLGSADLLIKLWDVKSGNEIR